MNLAQAIQQAHERNEQAIATRIAAPRLDEDQVLLSNFVKWTKENGVRCLPAVPACVAAYLRTLTGQPETILKTVEAIDAWHVNQDLGSPTATPAVRNELATLLTIALPKSWSKDERLVFAGLPIEAQEIIERHARLNSNAVRKAQNERDVARQELKQLLNQKEISNG